jgi:hypothetical protein
MTTNIKLHAALPSGAIPDNLGQKMWDGLGGHHMAIVELRVAERTEPAHDDDTDPSAKLRVVGLEFAQDKNDDELLRHAQQNRYLARTGKDTLDETGLFAQHNGDPSKSFHAALVDVINKRGQIAGHTAHAEQVSDELVTITIARKAAKPKA